MSPRNNVGLLITQRPDHPEGSHVSKSPLADVDDLPLLHVCMDTMQQYANVSSTMTVWCAVIILLKK